MKLSTNFTLEEMCASQIAARFGFDNRPNQSQVINLKKLCMLLESVRSAVGDRYVKVNSGYRCLEVNSKLGSKPTSQHTQGLAADIVCQGFGSPRDLMIKILDTPSIRFDQLILEFNSWVHISTCANGKNPRMQALIIDKSGSRGFS